MEREGGKEGSSSNGGMAHFQLGGRRVVCTSLAPQPRHILYKNGFPCIALGYTAFQLPKVISTQAQKLAVPALAAAVTFHTEAAHATPSGKSVSVLSASTWARQRCP